MFACIVSGKRHESFGWSDHHSASHSRMHSCHPVAHAATIHFDSDFIGDIMLTPYGLDINENCTSCQIRSDDAFCHLSPAELKALEAVRYAATYPKGAILFVEGQAPRGVYLLCKGQVKLTLSCRDGKTLIMKIVDAGEVLGLGATVSGAPYEVTAETMDPCQVSFVRRDDFLRLMKEHIEICLAASQQLSEKYNAACREMRSLALSNSAAEKLTKLLMRWSTESGESAKSEPHLKIGLTHEEIAQIIGTSRETVTRLFSELKKQQIVQSKGLTLLIRKKAALQALTVSQ